MSSGVHPSSTQSVAERRTHTGRSSGHACRTAAATSSGRIGVIGTVIGAVSGATLAHVFDTYRVITIPSDVYQVSYLPFKVQTGDLIAVVLGAVVVCFVATLYPSRQAARLDPAQALRYE